MYFPDIEFLQDQKLTNVSNVRLDFLQEFFRLPFLDAMLFLYGA